MVDIAASSGATKNEIRNSQALSSRLACIDQWSHWQFRKSPVCVQVSFGEMMMYAPGYDDPV